MFSKDSIVPYVIGGISAISMLLVLRDSSNKNINNIDNFEATEKVGCPFSSADNSLTIRNNTNENIKSGEAPKYVFLPSASKGFCLETWVANNERLVGLYEDFVHLVPVRNSWFADDCINSDLRASMQSFEMCYILLSQFIADQRDYSPTRYRIENITKDISSQSQMLNSLRSEFVSCWKENSVGLKSPLNCSQSEGLNLVINQLNIHYPTMSSELKQTMKMMVSSIYRSLRSISLTYNTLLGIESQLNSIIHLVEMNELYADCASWINNYSLQLAYENVVQSKIILHTSFAENYEHFEDYFFRTVHLGTESWGKVGLSFVDKAYASAAKHEWKQAAYYVEFASDILSYMGNHILALSSMNVRDYLVYKVMH